MSSMSPLMDLMIVFPGVIFVLIPEMSRSGILFGVTVAPDFRETADGRRLLVSYRRTIAFVTLGVLALAHILPARQTFIPLWIGLHGFASTACLILFSKRTRSFAEPDSSIRTASLVPQPRSLPGGWFFLLGPFLILGLAALSLYANWNSIPEKFPIHWGIDGTPNGWAARTSFGVFGGLLIAGLVNAVNLAIACAVIFRTRNAGEVAFKRATYFLIVIVSYFVSTLLAGLSTRPVWSADPGSSPSPVLLPVTIMVSVALALGFIIYLSRISRARGGAGDGTPDACWKWGMIYYNPQDPSLLVEKRMGLGWTFNFANKWSWVFMALLLLPPLLIILVVSLVK